jgi:hypothetical protein
MTNPLSGTKVDLGDDLLAEILDTVRRSGAEDHRKVKALVRAGKIGEMYLGALADDCSYAALSPSSARETVSPSER